jgi:hypothetical protein
VLSRAEFPFYWAAAADNLGATLRALAARQADRAQAREAAELSRAALAVFREADAPLHAKRAGRNLEKAEVLLA